MIDRGMRDQYAEHLRHFATGRMTIEDFERSSSPFYSADRGLIAVGNEALNLLSGGEDLPGNRFRLPYPERRTLARFIAFLHSDAEYAWPLTSFGGNFDLAGFIPPLPLIASLFLSTVVPGAWIAGILGSVACWRKLEWPTWRAYHEDIWPFRNAEELEAARRHPRLLSGGHHG